MGEGGSGGVGAIPYAEDVLAVCGGRFASTTALIDAPPMCGTVYLPAYRGELIASATIGLEAGIGDVVGDVVHTIGDKAFA